MTAANNVDAGERFPSDALLSASMLFEYVTFEGYWALTHLSQTDFQKTVKTYIENTNLEQRYLDTRINTLSIYF